LFCAALLLSGLTRKDGSLRKRSGLQFASLPFEGKTQTHDEYKEDKKDRAADGATGSSSDELFGP
jgi:hypothetical protein